LIDSSIININSNILSSTATFNKSNVLQQLPTDFKQQRHPFTPSQANSLSSTATLQQSSTDFKQQYCIPTATSTATTLINRFQHLDGDQQNCLLLPLDVANNVHIPTYSTGLTFGSSYNQSNPPSTSVPQQHSTANNSHFNSNGTTTATSTTTSTATTTVYCLSTNSQRLNHSCNFY